MNATEIQIARLESICRRLRFVGKIQIGLNVVLLAFMCVGHQLISSLEAEPENDLPAWHSWTAVLPYMIRLSWAGLGLFLIWSPALVVCLFQLKKLKK